MTTYCKAVRSNKLNDYHKTYHDIEYGYPNKDDNQLFGLLVLEINQAGLSWDIVLKKKDSFWKAYDEFNVEKVASYNQKDINRLLKDAGIIRNKLKIQAAIHNANIILGLQKEFGSFKNWLDMNHPKTRDEWTKLFKKTFKFTGGEIVNEFLISTSHLPGAHDKDCPTYKNISKLNPVWNRP